MQDKGLEPDREIYSILLGSCTKNLDWQLSLQLLDHMRQRGMPLDTGIYSHVVSCCERSQEFGIVLKLLEEMRLDGISSEAIGAWRSRLSGKISHLPVWQRWEKWRSEQAILPVM